MEEKVIKVTNKGMISIPAKIRKKFNINDGDFVLVKEEDNRKITIVPIESIDTLRERALTVEEFRKVFERSRKEDLELEK